MSEEETTKEEYKYAGISDRLFAAILDLTLISIIIIPLSNFLFPILFGIETPLREAIDAAIANNPKLQLDDEALTRVILNEHPEALVESVKTGLAEALLQFAFMGLYFIPITAKKGRTFGKFILGLRVLDSVNGENISMLQATIRYISYPVSAFPLFLGFIWGSFRKDKRTWHDLLADSQVIYDDKGWYKLLWQKIKSKFAKDKTIS